MSPAGHLDFDAESFDVKGALGLKDSQSVSAAAGSPNQAADESMTLLDDNETHASSTSGALTVLNGSETRRRRPSGGAKKGRSPDKRRDSRSLRETNDEEEDDGITDSHRTVGPKGRKPPASDFSFQVHHHHAPDTQGIYEPERWLNSNTPHILLG